MIKLVKYRKNYSDKYKNVGAKNVLKPSPRQPIDFLQ